MLAHFLAPAMFETCLPAPDKPRHQMHFSTGITRRGGPGTNSPDQTMQPGLLANEMVSLPGPAVRVTVEVKDATRHVAEQSSQNTANEPATSILLGAGTPNVWNAMRSREA